MKSAPRPTRTGLSRSALCSTPLFRILLLGIFLAGCTHGRTAEPVATTQPATRPSEPARPSRTVVVWISIDGFRHDYVDRTHAPFLTGLMGRGAFSRQLTPIFPSLTFPSHVAEATGVQVKDHGVPGNGFFDPDSGQTTSFPNDSVYLQAEPIWITAPRQGVRTAVYDWPLSQKQTGAVRSDYFAQSFDNAPTDEQRLEQLTKTWRDDNDPRPLRLLMSYVHATDTAGHRFGPDSPRVDEAVLATDALLQKYVAEWMRLFDQKMSPDDELYVVFTTDHGMSTVRTQVNLPRLLGQAYSDDLRIVSGSAIANIFLDRIPEARRAAVASAIVDEICCLDYAQAYRKADLPAKWGYDHPKRVGDVVITVNPGYSMNNTRSTTPSTLPATQPVTAAVSKGMHGYDPEAGDDMLGLFVAWRYRKALGGTDLGKIESLRIHPTVCRLLGIAPASGATRPPIDLP